MKPHESGEIFSKSVELKIHKRIFRGRKDNICNNKGGKNFRYCSALNCITKVPNSSDINLHIVKEEWFQNTVPWKRAIPRLVCDLHFTSDCFKTSYVGGRKKNRLKSDSKPLTG